MCCPIDSNVLLIALCSLSSPRVRPPSYFAAELGPLEELRPCFDHSLSRAYPLYPVRQQLSRARMDAQEPAASTSDPAFDVEPLRSLQGSTSGRRVWDDDESQALHEIVAQASSPVNWEDVVALLGARFPDRSLRSAAQCKNRIGNFREYCE